MLLSVLVPLYNEEEYVGALLDRVLAAPLPAGVDSEVVVVDDGSSDDSAAVVEALCALHPGRIRLVRHEAQPRERARRCAPPSNMRGAISASFRTPTWNTTPGSIRSCSGRC